jgi:hypothetical protein
LSQREHPFAEIPEALRQELLQARDRLLGVYADAEADLAAFGRDHNRVALRHAAEVLCEGLRELGDETHPLWRALREHPAILVRPEVSEMRTKVKDFITAETAILSAAGMNPETAKELAAAVGRALTQLDPAQATAARRSEQVLQLIRASGRLREGVCESANRLREPGWELPERRSGIRGLASKVTRSKWFVGGATVAVADLTTGALPILGWFAAAATSPATAIIYMLDHR